MKNPEEYLKNLVNNCKGKNEPYLDSSYFIYDGTVHPIINIIKQAQIDAYNEALDDAVGSAYVEVDTGGYPYVYDQSILKLKK
jgi:hypothetical protein